MPICTCDMSVFPLQYLDTSVKVFNMYEFAVALTLQYWTLHPLMLHVLLINLHSHILTGLLMKLYRMCYACGGTWTFLRIVTSLKPMEIFGVQNQILIDAYTDCLETCAKSVNVEQNHMELNRKEFAMLKQRAEIYYAYSFIDQSINEPFRITRPETLFNIARYLLCCLPNPPPPGISLVNILVTLAKHGEQLGCYKIARHAYGRLQGLHVPASWSDKLDIATLAIRAKAAIDNTSLQLESPLCYCCSSPLPLIPSSDQEACEICLQPVFRSFLTFDHLPLVEFFVKDDITPERAVELIQTIPSKHVGRQIVVNGSSESGNCLGQLLLLSTSKQNPGPIQINEASLLGLHPSQVIIQKSLLNKETVRYFHVIDASLALCQCSFCNHLFEQEDWDLALLQFGSCPFCHNLGTPVSSALPVQPWIDGFIEGV
eukprot:Gb_02614 [translate_table: standard]